MSIACGSFVSGSWSTGAGGGGAAVVDGDEVLVLWAVLWLEIFVDFFLFFRFFVSVVPELLYCALYWLSFSSYSFFFNFIFYALFWCFLLWCSSVG